MNKAIVAAIAVILAAFLAFLEKSNSSERAEQSALIGILYQRVDALEEKYLRVVTQNQIQASKITKLTIELSDKYSPDEALKTYIDNMPFPAWVKVVNGSGSAAEFTMWHLNREYEDVFNIRKESYIGKTDFEVWPQRLALGFYENDLSILNTEISACNREEIKYTPIGPIMESTEFVQVCKWRTKIMGKRAVAGQLLPSSGS